MAEGSRDVTGMVATGVGWGVGITGVGATVTPPGSSRMEHPAVQMIAQRIKAGASANGVFIVKDQAMLLRFKWFYVP